MTWRMGPRFTVLLALWLVCASEPHPQATVRDGHGGRKVPLVSRDSSRPARFLRYTGRSRGIQRSAVEEPNLQHLQRRRSVPVLRLARPAERPARLDIDGAPTRPEQRPAARSSPREMIRDEGSSARSKTLRFPSGSGSPNILASFAGKNRVWVISAPHASEGYYRLMMSLLKDDVYCELAERHIQQIVLFHQAGEEGGKVRRITSEGRILEQPLDPSLIPKLMSFLKLEKGKFGMVLLKKTLQVEERYPYPVRLEAMYEVIDQGPIRRIEKIRQKGFVQKCKAAGVEGHVVEEGRDGGAGGQSLGSEKRKEDLRGAQVPPTREGRLKVPGKLAPTTLALPSPPSIPRATTPPPSPATTAIRSTPRVVTVAARPVSTTASPTTQRPWTPAPSHRPPTTTEVITARGPSVSENLYPPPRKDQHRERPQSTRRPGKATSLESFTDAPPTTASEPSARAAGPGRFRDNGMDRREHGQRGPNVVPGPPKPAKEKPPKKKAQDKVLSNEYEDKYDLSRPTATQLQEELQVGNVPPKKAKESRKHEKLEKPEKEKKKKMKNENPDKLLKSEKQMKKSEKKSKQEKEKGKKKKGSKTEQSGHQNPGSRHVTQSPRKSAADLLGPLEGKRRLLNQLMPLRAALILLNEPTPQGDCTACIPPPKKTDTLFSGHFFEDLMWTHRITATSQLLREAGSNGAGHSWMDGFLEPPQELRFGAEDRVQVSCLSPKHWTVGKSGQAIILRSEIDSLVS
ncbi:Coiled-coil domain-containing protein 80 [Saguinus oedipus]|uniref:Coiled-coil domain-containing protein 80 n=1 Tax=Saguinus oedipus TaxID=9490 RepID=A0ABQ9U5D6_SAGOE|nr:Coiled-coil domain-containing protein 80 [Saguinus oedipus]